MSAADATTTSGADVVRNRGGTGAVIVSYKPELELLETLIRALVGQVQSIVLIDNGSSVDLLRWSTERQIHMHFELQLLGENRGVAAAHNIGIQWARERGCQYVLLMDQDSIPAPDMVALLLAAMVDLAAPAAVGPRLTLDRAHAPAPFVRTRGWQLVPVRCADDADVVEVDYLISSGCLIPLSVIDQVGPMRDDYFIDYVDIEWGLRARHHGLRSFGVCAAAMQHRLGDAPQRIFGRSIGSHSPIRHYYFVRNALLLYRAPWLDLRWKLVDGWRLFQRIIVYALLVRPHVRNFSMVTLGVFHGLAGKSGKLTLDRE